MLILMRIPKPVYNCTRQRTGPPGGRLRVRTPAGMPPRRDGVGWLARRERPKQTGVSDGGASPFDPPDMTRPKPTKRIATNWPTMKAD